jgi:hypothetical protein
MKFADDDIKQITKILLNVYSLAKKKKLQTVPNTFKEFIIENINNGLCPEKCINYVNQ